MAPTAPRRRARRSVCALVTLGAWVVMIVLVVMRPHFEMPQMDHAELGKVLKSNYARFMHIEGPFGEQHAGANEAATLLRGGTDRAETVTTEPPTLKPTAKPTTKPTTKPTMKPTMKPTEKPTTKPTEKPTAKPREKATAKKKARKEDDRGSMTCGGREVRDSEVVYWRRPGADAAETARLKRPIEEGERYVTFEYDAGGWNNIRMGVECVFVLAHYTGRTIVLPPKQQLYLISKEHEKRRAFGLADFLNVTLLAQHSGWTTISMDDFLTRVDEWKKMPEAPRDGTTRVWKYMERVSDELLPPVTRKFFVFPNQTQLTRIEEMKKPKRYAAFVNGRSPLTYGESLAKARHVHVPGGGSHRILMNFYNFAFFDEPETQRYYRRFIRDYARYTDAIFCAADLIVRALRAENDTYYALHVRRNDFQFKSAKIGADEIIQNLNGHAIIPSGSLVYLATDDPNGKCAGCMHERKSCATYPVPRPVGCPDDPSWDPFFRHGWRIKKLNDYAHLVPHLNPNYFGMVDQVVCSRAAKYAGTFWSTFSGYIHRLRGYHGLGEHSYYHTKGKLLELQTKKSVGPGWVREWRAGWVQHDDY